LILKPASPGDDVQQAFARWLWHDAAGWRGSEFISPITAISELFWVTNATTACGSIALFLIRSTISWSTLGRRFARCWDLSRVGDKEVPTDINRLIRQRLEIHGPTSRSTTRSASRLSKGQQSHQGVVAGGVITVVVVVAVPFGVWNRIRFC
jgi:hypothetical protein